MIWNRSRTALWRSHVSRSHRHRRLSCAASSARHLRRRRGHRLDRAREDPAARYQCTGDEGDCPAESAQAIRARDRLVVLLRGRKLLIERKGTDRYGRIGTAWRFW